LEINFKFNFLFFNRVIFHVLKFLDKKLIISGFIAMLLFQQIQNIGMNIGILPITGITLPFISYGGSSLISYMIIIGIIINIKNSDT